MQIVDDAYKDAVLVQSLEQMNKDHAMKSDYYTWECRLEMAVLHQIMVYYLVNRSSFRKTLVSVFSW